MNAAVISGVISIYLFSVVVFARPLRIASIPEEPLRYYTKDRKLTGIDVDILDRIFRPSGIPYKIILLHSSDSLREFYEKKLCDMVLTLSKNPEREKYLDFSEISHLSVAWKFYAKKETAEKLRSDNFEDLLGKRIGVTRNFAYTSEFWHLINSGKVRVIWEDKNATQIDHLVKNETDVVMLNSLTAEAIIKNKNLTGSVTAAKGEVRKAVYYNAFVKESGYPKRETLIEIYHKSLKKLLLSQEYQNILKAD